MGAEVDSKRAPAFQSPPLRAQDYANGRIVSTDPSSCLNNVVTPNDPAAEIPWSLRYVPSITNFSLQYNLASASLALTIMGSRADDVHTKNPDFPCPEWADKTLLALAYGGTFLGMLLFGRAGDIFGRHPVMVVTQLLTAFGIVLTAFLTWFAWGGSFWYVMSLGRLVVGIGIGGMYPLAGSIAAELEERERAERERAGPQWSGGSNLLAAEENNPDSKWLNWGFSSRLDEESRARIRAVGVSFFWQTPGVGMPYAWMRWDPVGPSATMVP